MDSEKRGLWNVRAFLALLAFGCLIWLTYRIGIAFYFEPEDVATFWLTNGIVIGALIVAPRRMWMPFLAVQYVVQFLLNLGFSLEFATIVTTVNSLSAFAAAAAVKQIVGIQFDTRRLRHMLVFIAAVLLAEALNGLGGALAVVRRVDAPFWNVWQIWTFSTATGSLIVGSATIAVAGLVNSRMAGFDRRRVLEALILIVLTIAACHLIFTLLPIHETIFGMPFFILVFLIWAALRLGPDITLGLLLIVSLQLVYYTDRGLGLFADPARTTYEHALMLQGYLLMNLLVTLIVTALNAEKDSTLRELKASRERFRSLVETTSDWVWEVDKLANYTYVSPRVKDILGYEPHELVGKSCYDLMPPEEAERISAAFNELASQGEGFHNMQNVNLHKNGARVILETSGEPFFDGRGRLLGYRGIDRDITERVQAEEEKLRMQSSLTAAKRVESLGALAGGVAHDLNNILGPVVALPELVREELAQADMPQEQWAQTRGSLDMMEESARQAARVVADLLALGRRSRHEFRPFDLTALPSMFLEGHQFQKLKENHPGTKVRCETDEEELLIEADADSLLRVAANLIMNALESLGGRGEVVIRTYREQFKKPVVRREVMAPGSYAVLSVSDNGFGIEEADLEHIFEPFFSRKGKTRHSGSGLGLSVVHGLVKDHQGYLDIKSSAGEGSTFLAYFPESASGTAAESGERESGVKAVEKARVLVVDDLDIQRFLCRRCLEPLGYEVFEAVDGRAAVKLFEEAKTANREAPFDIVILDMVLEADFDGCSACESIVGLYPGMPIVIVSGHAENERFETARKLGATILGKPYTQKQLINAIAEHLA